jgi:hypothetical protein
MQSSSKSAREIRCHLGQVEYLELLLEYPELLLGELTIDTVLG